MDCIAFWKEFTDLMMKLNVDEFIYDRLRSLHDNFLFMKWSCLSRNNVNSTVFWRSSLDENERKYPSQFEAAKLSCQNIDSRYFLRYWMRILTIFSFFDYLRFQIKLRLTAVMFSPTKIIQRNIDFSDWQCGIYVFVSVRLCRCGKRDDNSCGGDVGGKRLL